MTALCKFTLQAVNLNSLKRNLVSESCHSPIQGTRKKLNYFKSGNVFKDLHFGELSPPISPPPRTHPHHHHQPQHIADRETEHGLSFGSGSIRSRVCWP